MSFFTSLFSCCLGSSENKKTEAEARHARIMNMYTSDNNPPASPIMQPPPCYADIAHDRPYIPPSEKSGPASLEEPQPQYPQQARRSSISGSSVVSIPSTRLSDLTSMYTGRTRRIRNQDGDEQSERNGSDAESAPPSYYAGSERSLTPIPEPTAPQPAMVAAQHPVMEDGWWQELLIDAERRRSRHREMERLHRDQV